MSPKATSPYDSLRQRDQDLRAEIDALTRERSRVILAPVDADTVVDNMRRIVGETSEAWRAEHGAAIVRALSGGLDARRDGTLRKRAPRMVQLPRAMQVHDTLYLRDLIGLAPEVVGDRLEEIIRAQMQGVETGAPLDERPALLAEIDARIRNAEDAHAAVVDEAAALDPPLQLAYLPGLLARRQREAEDAEDRARQTALRAQIDADYGAPRSRVVAVGGRGRGSVSQYIESGGKF